ncbi:MAG TPA: aminotransferase class V-fold PLP-dependent enzyme [Pyrinomonadaceae bacterium]|jgi:selenocysteine lyase/cysteine desulfurase
MNSEIRSLFSALEHYTYLNSAAVSPLPKTAIAAVNSQLEDVAAHGSAHYLTWLEKKNSARSILARMLNVRPENIAFTRNTSDGFAAIANGITWQPDDNIVSFAREFPANYYAWRSIRDRFGVELRLCPERDGGINLDELIAMIDSNTRVVAISSVQFGSGFRADLERIGRAARAVDALFCVDLIQGLGAHAYDLPAQYVDAASGATHKWLCAPEGCGYLYVSDRARDRIEPVLTGWISVETPWDFEDREQPFKPNALAWESGTGASSLFYGLEESLNLLDGVGLAKIESHLEQLTDQLCDSLAGKDYDIVSSRAPGERSAIVCIAHRTMDCNEVAKQLADANIVVSPREGRIRVAPHFYNDSSDIERLIEVLP